MRNDQNLEHTGCSNLDLPALPGVAGYRHEALLSLLGGLLWITFSAAMSDSGLSHF